MKAFPLCAIVALTPFLTHAADAPRVLPAASLPADKRLEPLKDLDGYFPWTPYNSKIAWDNRAATLKTQIRVALGIWPEPTRTPRELQQHGEGEDPRLERQTAVRHHRKIRSVAGPVKQSSPGAEVAGW